jgi:hypothetical protein
MTLEQLLTELGEARWFESLGRYEGAEGTLAIRDLEPWRSEDSADPQGIARQLRWLPTKVSEDDPVHGASLRDTARQLGRVEELKRAGLEAYKVALASMSRASPQPLLRVGPHDFTEAAKGAAAFAARAAAGEIVVEKQGFWCSVISLYRSGHWPCGLLPDRTLVVL